MKAQEIYLVPSYTKIERKPSTKCELILQVPTIAIAMQYKT